jgi:hypothetical protein
MNVQEITKQRILEKCVKDVPGWKVLIVDRSSMKIISAACKVRILVFDPVLRIRKKIGE